MSISSATLRTKAKALAQNAASTSGTGVQLLLNDPGDYDEAIANALAVFDTDRPNRRVKDVTVGTAGFRFPLNGAGAVLPASTDPDGWVDGGSYVTDVWFPYLTADQGVDPIDRNLWRVVSLPGSQDALELLADRAAVGQVLRLEYVRPHVLAAADTGTSIRLGDQRAIITLSASMILMAAATKAVQNTGNTGLPNDVVDRRSQSDIFKSRAKDLRDIYGQLVGAASADNASPASGFRELDALMSFRSAPLWHPNSTH